MKAQVPEFQAWKCHGSGMRLTMKPRKAKIGNSGYVGSMSSERDGSGYVGRTL